MQPSTLTPEQAVAGASNPNELLAFGNALKKAQTSFKETAKGSSTTPTQTSPSIDFSQLGAVTSRQTPTLPQGPSTSMDRFAAAVRGATSILPQDNAIAQEKLRLQRQQLTGLESLKGKSAFEQQANVQFGIPDLEIEKRDIENTIKNVRASLAEGLVNESGRVVPMEVITGRQAFLERKAASRLVGLEAAQSAISNQILTAQDQVQRAVDLKYGPILEALEIEKQQLSVLGEIATDEEKRMLEQKEQELTIATAKYGEERQLEEQSLNAINTALFNERLDPTKGAQLISDLTSGKITPAQVMAQVGGLQRTKLELLQEQQIRGEIADAATARKNAAEAFARGELNSQQLSLATDLRKEVNGLEEVKTMKGLEPKMVSLLVALDKGTGEGDIAAINAFQNTVVDPGVAVREGDVALIQSAQSYGDKAWLKAQGLLKGDKLTPDGRERIRDIALSAYDARVKFTEENTQPVKTIAAESGIDYNKYIGKPFLTAEELQLRVPTSNVSQEEESQLNQLFGGVTSGTFNPASFFK